MRYLTLYRDQTSVTSNDGKIIPANYINHKIFDFANRLSCGLHYVFNIYSVACSYSKGYELRKAIGAFLDFVTKHNERNDPLLQIVAIEDIGAEEYRQFEDYLLKNNLSAHLARRLKTAFIKSASTNDDGFPLLRLPVISVPESQPREPLPLKTDQAFFHYMHSVVDRLRGKLAVLEQMTNVHPYDRWEVREICSMLMNGKTGTNHQYNDWKIDPLRALRTLGAEGFPFHVSTSFVEDMLLDAADSSLGVLAREPIDLLLSCCIPHGYLRRLAPNCVSMQDLMAMYYPTAEEQAALVLFIQRLTGWNKETVLAIDRNNFVHPLSEIASTDTVLLISEKRRGSISDTQENPKIIKAYSSRCDQYSAYNLILLAKELSKPCARLLCSKPGTPRSDPCHFTPFLFYCKLSPSWRWNNSLDVNSCFSSLHVKHRWNNGVAKCLKNANLQDQGVPLLNAESLEGRLRATWMMRDRDSGHHSISLTAMLQGHKNTYTTDIHYDNSAAANMERRERFQLFQEALVNKLHQGNFKGLLGAVDAQEARSFKFRVFTIVGHTRALWACMDSSNPDYLGCLPLAAGERCTRLEKCLVCSRIYVFADSLPFLIERLAVLEMQMERNPGQDAEVEEEVAILRYILDHWGNSRDMREALDYMDGYGALLPIDMRSLIAYIED
ncbi:hypothetical protein [Pseudomonas taiwanensis]|uniref:hypothetical protein n=1 Tax=Pseudomonas taiwanensis TaxID=470150 RepID=UPI001644043D|nr:hypothetical protein [Pseudomonas taiwanensis]MBC3492421.1 hypothetical protein [Pseudomonas taiwanensis]